jgi:thioester reductase-like protein
MGLLLPIATQAEKHPDKLLFSFLDIYGSPTESYTYAEFLRRVADIASYIHRTAQPAPGTRVLLVYPPGLEMIAGLLACTSLGLIPVPVYPPSKHDISASMDRMAFVAQDCGARLLLTTRACSWLISWAQVRRKLGRLSLKSTVIDQLPRVLSDEAPALGEPLLLAPPEGDHSDILFLQYTSGSTRDPKGVQVTHEGLLANYRSTVDHDPVCVSWLPQYHDLGLIGYYLFIALHGGTTYGFSPFDFIHRPALWLETLSKYQATATAAPNFAFAYCLRPDKVPESTLDGLDLSRLDYLATAAEPVHAETFRRFRARFARCGLKPRSVFSSYGLAEYTLVVSQYGRRIQAFDREQLSLGRVRPIPSKVDSRDSKELVSCGRPLACTSVKIVSAEGAPRGCAVDEVGEIWLHGPSMGAGYWGRPKLSAQVFQARLAETGDQDWLRTGDLGFLHDGELYISGRLKDLIILRGRNHYPQDVESVVEADADIRPGCSAAFSVERDGQEALVVVAELKHPKRVPDVRRLNQLLLTEAGISAATWVFIRPRSIAKTSSGKIRRHRVRTDFLEQRLAVVERVESSTPATPGSRDPSHPLLALFQEYGLTGTEDETLTEAGLDSLQLAGFARDLQDGCEALGVSLSSEVVDLRLLQTIGVVDLFEFLGLALEGGPAAVRRSRELLMGLERERHQIETRLMLEDSSTRANSWRLPAGPAPSEEGGIFLTGGTGFLGPFLVHNLLKQTQDPLTVLVRGDHISAARARLLQALEVANLHLSSEELGRLRVVCGDLGQPRLGLTAQDWDRLASDTHTIVHNGALVNYLYNYEAMRDANVLGTREVLRLAFAERLKVFNHISTTFVFGWSKQDRLHEQDNNEDLDLLDFGYSQTKWVSEQIVQGALSAGLPGRIFRPALISPTGECCGAEADISIRLLAFMLKHGLGTSAPNQVSFTPVDQVARNIVAIAQVPESLGQRLHVTRDDDAKLADVTDILGRLSGRPIELLELHDFVDAVIERCTKDDPLFPLLNFFVRSTEKISAMSFKRYDNSQYRAARALAGCADDPSLESVVSGIYQFMKKQGLAAGGLPAPTSVQDNTTGD